MDFQYQGLERYLEYLEIKDFNEMQKAFITANREHNNTQLLSPTGSGKTLAFLLATLEHLNEASNTTQALIIVPSRELAQQIDQVFRSLRTGLKLTTCYGGHKREIEENNLIQAPAIIIGTPGRLCDHLRRGNITADTIHTLVLDEFDKTLEAGFQEEVQFIYEQLPNLNRRMLTSATAAVDVPAFIEFDKAEVVNFVPEDGEANTVALDYKFVKSTDTEKAETIVKLICQLGARPTIIFCNQRDSVEHVAKTIKDLGIPCEFYHGQMEQRDRDAALCKFRNGTTYLLVTTDIAARGLDIPFVRYIIHYHLPYTEESFVHRNGRTARMEASGTAILVLSPKEYLPEFIPTEEIDELKLIGDHPLPDKPKWVTLYLPLGKKNKISKGDIAGFMINQGELKSEDLGLIEVKDFSAFIAVRRTKASHVLHVTKEARIKNKKAKLSIAK